jgi:hypothetical protein
MARILVKKSLVKNGTGFISGCEIGYKIICAEQDINRVYPRFYWKNNLFPNNKSDVFN